MAGKAHDSHAPATKIRDASGDLDAHRRRPAGVTTTMSGVGEPPRLIGAGTPDFRDNDGDGGAAGAGPDEAAMRGEA